MADDAISYVLGEYGPAVDPIHRKQQASGTYVDKFTYNEVIHTYDPDRVFPDKAVHKKIDDRLYYRYPGKAAIVIDDNTVKVHRDFNEQDGEQQAYFVLSILEVEGYVTGWWKIN